MRGWLDDAPSYMPPVDLDDAVRATTVGRVYKSKNPEFTEGQWVLGLNKVEEYSLVLPGGFTSPIDVDIVLSPSIFLSALGAVGLTAYFGLQDAGQPKAGETVLVSGAAGAVGSMVGQIAKIKGCNVIGIAGTEEKCNWLLRDLKVDGVINYKTENLKDRLKDLCPNGVDMYFDNVGGEITEAVINRFNIGGRMSICGQISGYNSETVQPGPRNWINILVKRLKVQGFIVFDYQSRAKEAFIDMSKWIAEGKLHHKNHIVDGLENAELWFHY